MEIIHLILGKANPNRMNGVNKVVYQLATRQAASGRKVSVWGITKDTSHNYGDRNFETVLFNTKKNPFSIDTSLKQAILSKKEQSVFHLHGGWIPIYSSISAFLSNHKIPFVLTAHGAYNTIAMQRSKFTKNAYFRIFEKGLLSKANKIHSIGESEVDGLQNIFPNNKSFLLPYGFEASETISTEKKATGDFIIGFVGRLDIYTKGLDLLVNSFQKFNQIYPKSKLWIVGDSDERNKFQDIINRKNLSEKVVLWGSKFGTEKDELMHGMHIFAHPSRNEGLPSSVLEASSMGIPCVVTKATNVAGYIRQMNAGVAIENEDEQAMTSAFEQLFKMNERDQLRQMSDNAKSMVDKIFNWDKIINDFDMLYS